MKSPLRWQSIGSSFLCHRIESSRAELLSFLKSCQCFVLFYYFSISLPGFVLSKPTARRKIRAIHFSVKQEPRRSTTTFFSSTGFNFGSEQSEAIFFFFFLRICAIDCSVCLQQVWKLGPKYHSSDAQNEHLYLLTFTTTSNGIKSCFEWFICIHLFSLFVWLGLKYSSYQRGTVYAAAPGLGCYLDGQPSCWFQKTAWIRIYKMMSVTTCSKRKKEAFFFSLESQHWEKELKDYTGSFFTWAALPENKNKRLRKKNNRVNKSRSLYVRLRSTWKHKAIFM